MYINLTPNKITLNKLSGSVYIDSSGSTAGSIMEKQLDFVKKLKRYLKLTKFIDWSTCSENHGSILPTKITSAGGTKPTCFLQHWTNETFGIILTDGQIDVNEMENFKEQLSKKESNIPIIIVFTISDINTTTIRKLQENINMSVPESFLALSNDVLIIISDGYKLRTLMSKGAFSETFPGIQLEEKLCLNNLPPFNYLLLDGIILDEGVPSNYIKINNNEYFDLNTLDQVNSLENIGLLEKICSRAMLPKLNLNVIHTVLDNLIQKCNYNPELDEVRNRLYLIAANKELAGTQEHKDLINLYNITRQNTRSSQNTDILGRINNLKQIINGYQRDSTSFTYGSNRAMKANEITETALGDIGICLDVECQILLESSPGYIGFKKPDIENFIQQYTSDYYLESPFELGQELIKWVTPGIYCQKMVERMDKNPCSMEPVIGWLPITTSPLIAMRQLSKMFGGRKELWHFARAYCGLLVYLSEKHWMEDYKEFLKNTLVKFMKEYNVSIDLKASDKKVPLYNSLEHVMLNYSICLRDRFYNDIVTICKIVDFAKPELNYSKQKIEAMSNFIRVFDKYLRIFKQNEDMTKYVMDIDDYGHYINHKKGIEGLIVQLLWYDVNGTYKLFKLQMAIDKSFSDKKFGSFIKKAFNNESWDESILNCALPELEGNELVYDVWTPNGLNDLVCGYTGKRFETTSDKLNHIKQLLGPHFFNGHSAVKKAIGELGINASEKDLFINAKERLYKAYGKQSKVLHTQRAKNRLLFFINKFKNN